MDALAALLPGIRGLDGCSGIEREVDCKRKCRGDGPASDCCAKNICEESCELHCRVGIKLLCNLVASRSSLLLAWCYGRSARVNGRGPNSANQDCKQQSGAGGWRQSAADDTLLLHGRA
ncbi:hypothetical protein BDV95DRAFT_332797 [Massariosphaeria phaeospora]|uniref:Uncharacterized protein n=1 Tax=Massariosphaeria phaeospora TaxID=100035 RepID=A0A7C8IA36_9PLEO|nr:hypothetical protein BDV95DRAFT_332797 [Massariosphaeria phaeospora]